MAQISIMARQFGDSDLCRVLLHSCVPSSASFHRIAKRIHIAPANATSRPRRLCCREPRRARAHPARALPAAGRATHILSPPRVAGARLRGAHRRRPPAPVCPPARLPQPPPALAARTALARPPGRPVRPHPPRGHSARVRRVAARRQAVKILERIHGVLPNSVHQNVHSH